MDCCPEVIVNVSAIDPVDKRRQSKCLLLGMGHLPATVVPSMWLLVVRRQTVFLASLMSHKVQCSDRCCSHCMLLQWATLLQPTILIFTSMPMTFRCTLPSNEPQCLDSLSQLITCTDYVTRWFIENGLLLNPSKTEEVVFGTASRLRSVDIFGGVKVAGTSLQFLDKVKLLSVELDQALYS